MSQQNVEVVREYIEALGTLSPEDVAQNVARFWEADGDLYPVRKFPETRPCHGVEEIVRFLTEYRDAWDQYEMEVKELMPVSDDRVLVRLSLRAEGRESGVRLEGDLYQCVWLRLGHFLRWEDHLTLKGALRALGLRAESLKAAGLSE
jgi:hypothetical protein